MPNARPLMTRNTPRLSQPIEFEDLLPGFSEMFEGANANRDFLPTPNWATDILFDKVSFQGSIWECACGNGKMSKRITERYSGPVVSSDIDDKGFGVTGIDFLKTTELMADNIVTNPPYSVGSAEEFVRHAIKLKAKKSAFLLRTLFLETITRYRLFKVYPPRLVIVISDRVMFDGSEEHGGCWCLSWFVWEKGWKGKTELDWAVHPNRTKSKFE